MNGNSLQSDNQYIEIFQNPINNLKQGKGSIISISGEMGYGKTHLLKSLESTNGIPSCALVECQAPVGRFNVGNLQPLLPFTRIIDKMVNPEDKSSAKKKLAKNLGLTLLASIPGPDVLFYFVKEASRDWRQYKKDKSNDEAAETKTSSTTREYYDTICSLADKQPYILLIDDMHWCDAQTVELLNLLAQGIESIPIILAFTYRKSLLQANVSPLFAYLQEHTKRKNNCYHIEMDGMSREQISTLCSNKLENYRKNSEFEDWLYQKSLGVPGVIIDYLKYFREHNPFEPDGSLKKDLEKQDLLPSSVHSAFSQVLEKLSDEERNLLTVCSAEGREFTALITADLLNCDVVTAIKKIRSLQNKTGIIRSTGAHVRYGIKTTTYEFSQAFYHAFFQNMLEYEEHIALHGQIAGLLKQRYEDAESDSEKEMIAPFLAAHSAESGDSETAKSMLLIAAQSAKKFGNADVIQNYYEHFQNVTEITADLEEKSQEHFVFEEMIHSAERATANSHEQHEDNGSSYENDTDSNGNEQVASSDFSAMRATLTDYLMNKKCNDAVNLAKNYLQNNENHLRTNEKAQIYSLIIKGYIDLTDISNAEKWLGEALELIKVKPDAVSECFVYNIAGLFYASKKEFETGMNYLQLAANTVQSLPPELKLLTISNIALMLDKTNNRDSAKYYDAARKLSSMLNFEHFANDLF